MGIVNQGKYILIEFPSGTRIPFYPLPKISENLGNTYYDKDINTQLNVEECNELIEPSKFTYIPASNEVYASIHFDGRGYWYVNTRGHQEWARGAELNFKLFEKLGYKADLTFMNQAIKELGLLHYAQTTEQTIVCNVLDNEGNVYDVLTIKGNWNATSAGNANAYNATNGVAYNQWRAMMANGEIPGWTDPWTCQDPTDPDSQGTQSNYWITTTNPPLTQGNTRSFDALEYIYDLRMTLVWGSDTNTFNSTPVQLYDGEHFGIMRYNVDYSNTGTTWSVNDYELTYTNQDNDSSMAERWVYSYSGYNYRIYSVDRIVKVNRLGWGLLGGGLYPAYLNILNNCLRDSYPTSANGATDDSADGDTEGTYDFNGTIVINTSLPSSQVLASDWLKCYKLSASDLTSLHTELWDNSFVNSLAKLVNNPLDTIIKFHLLPFDVTGNTEYIKVGNVQLTTQGLRVANEFIELNLGYFNCADFLHFYGMAVDYESQIEIFLPYINWVTVNINEVIDSIIYIKYRVDIMTGQAIAIIYNATKDRNVAYYSCNMSYDLPITSASADSIGIINSIGQTATSGLSLVGSLASGNPLAIGGSAINMLSSILDTGINNNKQLYQSTGGLGGSTGYLGQLTPMMRVTTKNCKTPRLHKYLRGWSTYKSGKVVDFPGFNQFEVNNVHVSDAFSINAKIVNYLNSGVRVEFGDYTPTTKEIQLLKSSSDSNAIGKTFTLITDVEGEYKGSVNLETININLEGLSVADVESMTHIYVNSLGYFYNITSRTFINNSIVSITGELDVLETFKDAIYDIDVVAIRSENSYNSLIRDSQLVYMENDYISYWGINSIDTFNNTLSGSSIILVCM